MNSTAITRSDLRIGDKVIITLANGRRMGMRVRFICDVFVAGQQVKITDPGISFCREVNARTSRIVSIERMAA